MKWEMRCKMEVETHEGQPKSEREPEEDGIYLVSFREDKQIKIGLGHFKKQYKWSFIQ